MAVIALWTVDLGFAKPHIERWVSEKTGREFAIDGVLNVNLGRQSVVIAQNVRISNADWADLPQMATVRRAEVRIDLGSIFDGPFIIDLIDVDGVDLNLIARADGDPNWAFDVQSEKKTQDTDADTGPFSVLIRQIDVDDVRAVLQSPDRDGPLNLDLEYFRQTYRSDDFLDLNARATLNGRRISFEAEAGKWQSLLSGSDVHFAIEAQIDTFHIASEGWIDDLTKPSRPSVTFTAQGPDINDLSKMLKVGDDGEGGIDISGSLSPVDDDSLELSVSGNIGQTSIEASGAFSDLQDLNNVALSLIASGPDLGRLTKLVGIKLSEKSPFQIQVEAERQGAKVLIEKVDIQFGEAELKATASIPNFPRIDEGRVRLALSGPRVERFRYATGLPGAATGPFSLNVDVDVLESGVEVLDLNLRTTLGNLRAQGQLASTRGFVGSELEVDMDIFSLDVISAAYQIRRLPDKPLSLEGKVRLTEHGARTLAPLRARTAAVDIAVEGLLTLQRGLLDTDLTYELSGDSLSEVTILFQDLAGVPNESFHLGGGLQIRSDGYRFSDAVGRIGTADFLADGLMVPQAGIGGSNFKFSLSGPKLEELLATTGLNQFTPGGFALSGEIEIEKDRINFKEFEFERERGKIDFDLELGLPVSRRWANFDVQANGRNIRTLIRNISAIELDELPFSAVARGELRGNVSSIDELRITVADASAEADGVLEFGEAAKISEFEIRAMIPSMSNIGHINGRRLGGQSLSIEAEIKGDQGTFFVEDFDVKIGDSDIRGSISFRAGDVPRLNVDVYSDSVVLEPLLEDVEEKAVVARELDDGRLIPRFDVPFDRLKSLNASLNIEIDELRRDHLFLRAIDVEAELQDGVFDLTKLNFWGRSGHLQSRARFGSEDAIGRVSLEAISRDLELGLAGRDPGESAKVTVDIDIEASGNNFRELAGTLDGLIYVDVRGGRSRQSGILSAIYGDMLNEIFRAINPFYRSDPYTRFECVIAPVIFNDGEVLTDPNMFIRTDKLAIVAKPEVSLKTEKIDIGVRTTPRKGVVISAGEILNPFIKVRGSLTRPYLAVDEQGVLISGGAAVATGGLSIVAKGIWDRVTRSKDPCGVAASTVVKTLGDRFPEFAELPGNAVDPATVN